MVLSLRKVIFVLMKKAHDGGDKFAGVTSKLYRLALDKDNPLR